ncbi:hypothetical protein MRB53_023050 [Persea americana]|uniref:Uncharacterized protein n=1 Tax=Persea americana TaxID=3435 RepID=A0ACC2L8A6_PERAE|nr:hypothetical protein MRB53_023050 [Persea americana]
MKQKIVIKVAMNCKDCRSKAMEIAAVFEGVISVAIEGKDLDLLVITGNEVDSACLVKRLRKKVGYAVLVTIAEQKIVMKVDMHCPKCRSKAMEIAAASHGVISVAIEGKEQDQVVVIGDEVDSTCLVKRLRKNVGCTNIVTIEEVKPKQDKKEEKKEEKPRCQPQCHGYPY